MNILLQDAGPVPHVWSLISNYLSDLIELFGHLYSLSSVCILTWFDDPNILWSLHGPIKFFLGFFRFLWLVILFFLGWFLIFFLWLMVLFFDSLFPEFYIVFTFLVVSGEPVKLRIIKAIFDMECERQVDKRIFIHGFIIVLHIYKQGLLIIDMEIVFNFVIQPWFGELDGHDILITDAFLFIGGL